MINHPKFQSPKQWLPKIPPLHPLLVFKQIYEVESCPRQKRKKEERETERW